MMRRVWPYLVLAGCYSDRALEIIVQDPDGLGVTHVELFIGRSTTDETEPLKLPAVDDVQPKAGRFEKAVWWSRLDPPTDVADHPSDIEPMTPTGARYQIRPSLDVSIDDVVASVVAVGYAIDPTTERRTPLGVGAVLHKMKMPAEGRDQYLIDLRPTTDIGAGGDRPGLRLWGGEAEQACVQVDAVPGLELHSPAVSAMIVRDGDLDCDGLGDDDANECFPDRYMAQAALSRDSLACAFSRPVTDNGTAACVVGGATCADGTGQAAGVCSPSSYCMPTASCAGCSAAQPCDPHRPGSQTNPYIECTILRSNVTGQSEFCEFPAMLELAKLFPGHALECDQVLGARMRKGIGSMWSEDIRITSNASSVFGTLRILPTPSPRSDHSCDFDLTPGGPVPHTSLMEPIGEFDTMLSIPLTAPSMGRGLVVPLRLRVLDAPYGCTGTAMLPACKLVPTTFDATLDGCLRTPPDPDTVVLD